MLLAFSFAQILLFRFSPLCHHTPRSRSALWPFPCSYAQSHASQKPASWFPWALGARPKFSFLFQRLKWGQSLRLYGILSQLLTTWQGEMRCNFSTSRFQASSCTESQLQSAVRSTFVAKAANNIISIESLCSVMSRWRLQYKRCAYANPHLRLKHLMVSTISCSKSSLVVNVGLYSVLLLCGDGISESWGNKCCKKNDSRNYMHNGHSVLAFKY